MEKIFEINYIFLTPEGVSVPDVAYVSGRTKENAIIRLTNFINLMGYCEYAGRKISAILDVKASEKTLKKAIIQTEKNGRLN